MSSVPDSTGVLWLDEHFRFSISRQSGKSSRMLIMKILYSGSGYRTPQLEWSPIPQSFTGPFPTRHPLLKKYSTATQLSLVPRLSTIESLRTRNGWSSLVFQETQTIPLRLQLYSKDRGVSQPIKGHAAAFAEIKQDGNQNPTKLFSFAVRTATGAKACLVKHSPASSNSYL
jgi:hypothetical protein